MSGIAHLGDYAQAPKLTKYAYFARALKPGMSPAEIRNAILTNPSPFASRPTDVEINLFTTRYQITASSSEVRFGFSSGLDALILKDTITGDIVAISAGVGPAALDLLTEGSEVFAKTPLLGANLGQFDDFYMMLQGVRQNDPNSLIQLFGHSQGVANTTLAYAASIRDGWESKIVGAYNFAGYGIDTAALL